MKLLTPKFIKVSFLSVLLLNTINAIAQQSKPDDKYSRMEIMIPMRDGVNLHTIIYTPKEQAEKLPFF